MTKTASRLRSERKAAAARGASLILMALAMIAGAMSHRSQVEASDEPPAESTPAQTPQGASRAGETPPGKREIELTKPAQARRLETINDTRQLPVVLLTGFEPFGPGKPANPSWEGIKPLDGQMLRGYRVVCRELPVEWGAPLERLPALIKELRPVAVFSFGQGLPGGFALESRAANRRAPLADNRGNRPPSEKIVEKGPAEFRASSDLRTLRDRLAKQGHTVRVSQNAGSYLCEECLYSLEYLRAQRGDSPLEVLFCHVPPLDGEKVTPRFVQAFVVDLLGAWAERNERDEEEGDDEQQLDDEEPVAKDDPSSPNPPESPTIPPGKKPAKNDPRIAEVNKFVERYFRTWSNREMDAYGDGFVREAVVQHIDERGNVTTQAMPEFLADQRRYQQIRPARETPLAADIKFEGPIARAVVYWKLEDASSPAKYGYDHFTLIRREGGWKIVNLVFYGVDPPKKSK